MFWTTSSQGKRRKKRRKTKKTGKKKEKTGNKIKKRLGRPLAALGLIHLGGKPPSWVPLACLVLVYWGNYGGLLGSYGGLLGKYKGLLVNYRSLLFSDIIVVDQSHQILSD